VRVPGFYSKQVCFAFGDQKLFCMYDHEKRSYIRIYNFKDLLTGVEKGVCAGADVKEIQEIQGSKDYLFTTAVWGPRNKSLIIATNNGRVIYYDLESSQILYEEIVHTAEIYSLTLTNDYTMLLTGSKDGNCKLLHPETFEMIRTFNYGKPCRTAVISPLYEDPKHQKFHLVCAGGQDAKDVTTTSADQGGFEMKMFSIIFNQKLAEIHGHFGPVHCTNFSPDGYSFASGAEDGYVHYHRFPPEYFTKKFE
jgi:translation initiation factor 3 subunit I